MHCKTIKGLTSGDWQSWIPVLPPQLCGLGKLPSLQILICKMGIAVEPTSQVGCEDEMKQCT